STNRVDGVDLLWRLSQLRQPRIKMFNKGTDYGEATYELLNGQSAVTLNIPRTGTTIVTPKPIRAGSSLLDAANDLMTAGGFWDLSATRYGKITSSAKTVLGESSVDRVIDAR